jgi:hypothetical protein
MQRATLGLVLSLAVLFPKVSNAQAYAYGTPPPRATAAAADWQILSLPIVVNGLVYYPTRAFRLYDAGVMAQTGIYEGVPVYADVTLEPFSVVYVPVSASSLRVYEQKREGALAGTTASRTPSFPVDIASDTVLAVRGREAALSAVAGATGTTGTTGTTDASPRDRPTATAATAAVARTRPDRRATGVESIPAPRATDGVWLEFDGSRWYADGAAVPLSADRFEPIGAYRGFAVYREKHGAANAIWVSVVRDGPVAPYRRR